MTDAIRVETLTDPDDGLQGFLWGQLKDHGLSRLNRPELGETAFLANIARLGQDIVGGTLGHVFYRGYYLQLLWVREDVRARGLGRQLLEVVERQARSHQCTVVFGFSFGFQAPGFYLKAGYKVFGAIEDFPAGQSCHFLSKQLT